MTWVTKWRKKLFRFSIKLLMVCAVLASLLAAYAANVWHQRRAEVAYLETMTPKLKMPFNISDPSKANSELTMNALF